MMRAGHFCAAVVVIAAWGMASQAAEPSAADAIKGCWALRATAPDPAVTYCFDQDVAGEFVTRSGDGDGWDGGGHYRIDGDRIRLDEGEGRTCTFVVTSDVLTISQCVADQTMGEGDPTEDTTWDRVQP